MTLNTIEQARQAAANLAHSLAEAIDQEASHLNDMADAISALINATAEAESLEVELDKQRRMIEELNQTITLRNAAIVQAYRAAMVTANESDLPEILFSILAASGLENLEARAKASRVITLPTVPAAE